MIILFDILFVLGIRFLIFDSSLFKDIRTYLYSINSKLLDKFLSCSYCQGFWIGLFYYMFTDNYIYVSIWFGFITAIVSLTWYVMTDALIRDMEAKESKK